MSLRKILSLIVTTMIFVALIGVVNAPRIYANVPQRQADSHRDTPPPDDMELLKIRLDQLQRLVEQQGRLMAMMEQRLAEIEVKLTTLTKVKSSSDSAEKPATEKPTKAKKSSNSQ